MFGECNTASRVVDVLLVCVQLISRYTLEFDRHQMKEVPLLFLSQTVPRSVLSVMILISLCLCVGQHFVNTTAIQVCTAVSLYLKTWMFARKVITKLKFTAVLTNFTVLLIAVL